MILIYGKVPGSFEICQGKVGDFLSSCREVKSAHSGNTATDDVEILELRINNTLWQAKRLLDSRCLKMAPEKTESLLVTDKRSFKYPNIVLGEHEIEWKKSIKYLDVQLDQRLSFGEHLQIATAKAIQCGAVLTRLMPNIGGPREAKRRLVASVVNS